MDNDKLNVADLYTCRSSLHPECCVLCKQCVGLLDLEQNLKSSLVRREPVAVFKLNPTLVLRGKLAFANSSVSRPVGIVCG